MPFGGLLLELTRALGDRNAAWVRELWRRHRRLLLIVGSMAMAVAAVGRLAYAAPYLVTDVESWAAVDLKLRHAETRAWFQGQPVYGGVDMPGDYPPGSYLLLWPLVGWLSLEAARWLWAAATLAALGVTAWVAATTGTGRGRGARPPFLPAAFLALLPFSVSPTQVNVYYGQIGVLVVAALVIGFASLHSEAPPGPARTVGASLLLLFSLVKPTLSAPFFWVLLFRLRWLRVASLVIASYVACTLWASAFQPGTAFGTVMDWFRYTEGRTGLIMAAGTSNLHRWLGLVGGERWAFPASLAVLAAHGLWTYRYRAAHLWVLLGVAAIVARLWVHHRAHDDLLLLVPMIALHQIAASGTPPNTAGKCDRDGSDLVAGLLFAAFWALLHVPNWSFSYLHGFAPLGIEAAQTLLWLVALAFLMRRAHAGTYEAPSTTAPRP